ncbi:MAG: hypothetical protein HKM29_01490 [Deltaproteobacteria bacterium]|nr:hypothetical protein [Deltaproteobacteria bacterium]NNG47974.1 hypothetical protein [Deltaproteobacteria bacterium]
MKRTPEELLDICLAMERRGEDWKAFLLAYPDCSQDVEKLVILAREVREASGPAEDYAPGASAALLRLGRDLAKRELQKEEEAHRKWGWLWGSAWTKAAFAGIVMLLVGASSVELSARTVPGNFLYPLKILTEKVRFALTPDLEERVELKLTFSERRLSEVVEALKEGKGADRELVSAMLDEARAALSDATKLPESKSSAYKARIASLEEFQKDRLRAVKALVSADRHQDVEEAIGMCDQGWARMREMMPGMHMGGPGQGNGREMGGMMMGPRGDRRRR